MRPHENHTRGSSFHGLYPVSADTAGKACICWNTSDYCAVVARRAGHRHIQTVVSVHFDNHQALRWNVEVELAVLHSH